jgi:DNA-binding Lrp family transcriptional regulator
MLLSELIKNSKRSDRELGRILQVSQATVTRTRKKLEGKLIDQYTVIPDLVEMGHQVLAFTFLSMKTSGFGDPVNYWAKAKEWCRLHTDIIYATAGEGLNSNGVIISVHKSIYEYHKLLNEGRRDWADQLESLQSFVISLENKEGVSKPFSFNSLATPTTSQ